MEVKSRTGHHTVHWHTAESASALGFAEPEGNRSSRRRSIDTAQAAPEIPDTANHPHTGTEAHSFHRTDRPDIAESASVLAGSSRYNGRYQGMNGIHRSCLSGPCSRRRRDTRAG